MGGVIIMLTWEVGEPMYGLSLPSHPGGYLRGLLFDGRCSCAKDSFAGHSGLYCGHYSRVA